MPTEHLTEYILYARTVRFRFAQSARRHRIGQAHALAAMAAAGEPVLTFDEGPQLHWVGLDDLGIELHIAGRPAIEDPDDLVIIVHVQPTSQRRPPL